MLTIKLLCVCKTKYESKILRNLSISQTNPSLKKKKKRLIAISWPLYEIATYCKAYNKVK